MGTPPHRLAVTGSGRSGPVPLPSRSGLVSPGGPCAPKADRDSRQSVQGHRHGVYRPPAMSSSGARMHRSVAGTRLEAAMPGKKSGWPVNPLTSSQVNPERPQPEPRWTEERPPRSRFSASADVHDPRPDSFLWLGTKPSEPLERGVVRSPVRCPPKETSPCGTHLSFRDGFSIPRAIAARPARDAPLTGAPLGPG